MIVNPVLMQCDCDARTLRVVHGRDAVPLPQTASTVNPVELRLAVNLLPLSDVPSTVERFSYRKPGNNDYEARLSGANQDANNSKNISQTLSHGRRRRRLGTTTWHVSLLS